MEETGSFDLDEFLDSITISKEPDIKQEKWINNVRLIKKRTIASDQIISRYKQIKVDLAQKNKELAEIRVDHRKLLEKVIPLEKQSEDHLAELSIYKDQNLQKETELEALSCHLNQLQALIKDLQSKNEAMSVEKSLTEAPSKTYIKHILLFGKMAENAKKLSKKRQTILDKYRQQLSGEDCESDKDEEIEMPPRCESADTGIGSSLALSEDEKLWSPESQLAQSHTYQNSPDNSQGLCEGEVKLSKHIIETNDASTSPHRIANTDEEESVVIKKLGTDVATCTSPLKKVSVAVSPIKNENTHSERLSPIEVSKENRKTFLEIATNTTPPRKIKVSSVATNTNKSPVKNGLARNILTPVDKTPVNIDKELQNDLEPRQKNIHSKGYNETDEEIQKIFKDMSFGLHLKELSPIAPTPDIVRRALQKLEPTPSVSKGKQLLGSLKQSKSQGLIRKIRTLRVINQKLRTTIKSQRVKLLNAHKMVNTGSTNNPLPQNEEELVKFLRLMSRVGSRFHIQEIKETIINQEKDHSESSDNAKKAGLHSSTESTKENSSNRDYCNKVLGSNTCKNNLSKENNVSRLETSEPHIQQNCSPQHNTVMEDIDDDVTFVRTAGRVLHKNALFDSSDEETTLESKEKLSNVTTGGDGEVVDGVQCKKRKLSKLDKLKKKWAPKSKILTDEPPKKKSRKSKVSNHCTELTNEPQHCDSNIESTPFKLNSKSVYEKAVQVMTELKAKQTMLKSSENKVCSRVTRSSLKTIALNKESSSTPISSPEKTPEKVTPSTTRQLRNRIISPCIESKQSSSPGSVGVQIASAVTRNLSVTLTPISNHKKKRKAHIPQQDSIVLYATKETSITPNPIHETSRNSCSNSDNDLVIETEAQDDALFSKSVVISQCKANIIKPAPSRTSQTKERAVKLKRVFNKVYVDLDSVQTVDKPESANHLQTSNFVSKTRVQALPVNNLHVSSTNINCSDLSNFESETKPASSGILHTSNTIVNTNIVEEASNIPANISQPSQISYSDLDMFSNEDHTDITNGNVGSTGQSIATKKQTETVNVQRNTQINNLNASKAQTELTRCSKSSSPLSGFNMKANTFGINKTNSCKDLTKSEKSNSPSGSVDIVNDIPSLKKVLIHGETAPADQISSNPIGEFFISMLKKYGKMTPTAFTFVPPITDKNAKHIENQLESSIGGLDTLPSQSERDLLVSRLETKNYKHFIVGLVDFLMRDQRRKDILCKDHTPPLPPMKKTEQVLLNVLCELQKKWPSVDLFNEILKNIEYKLFRLNHTPALLQVETLAHFYAVLCRFRKLLNRLRVFVVDAMYCMSFKALPLIRQVIDVWMHVLPKVKYRSANNLLVFTITYLLHYCRCEEYGLHQNLDMIRIMLVKRFNYNMTDWCEKTMLEKIRDAILHLKGIGSLENKLVATSFILIAKRSGVQWCQKNIIDGMLMPIIKSKTTREHVKAFCISLLGQLMRPYPNNMKLQCEMAVNHLLLIMEQNPSHVVEQAVLISLILLRRHNRLRCMEVLLSWRPKAVISPELEKQLQFLIEEKPLKLWKKCLCDFTRNL